MDAQKIIEKVLTELGLHSENLNDTISINGWTMKISTEFNLYQGHDLESLYKAKFPFLNSYQREDSLKKDIIEKVINDYPLLTPINLFEIIKRIK